MESTTDRYILISYTVSFQLVIFSFMKRTHGCFETVKYSLVRLLRFPVITNVSMSMFCITLIMFLLYVRMLNVVVDV